MPGGTLGGSDFAAAGSQRWVGPRQGLCLTRHCLLTLLDFGAETRVLGDPSKHAGTNVFAVMLSLVAYGRASVATGLVVHAAQPL